MFLLKTEDLNLNLEIVPVSTLISHEAIISNMSQRLTMEFANFANLQHPIIIEINNIVLDGNHRVSVFKKLVLPGNFQGRIGPLFQSARGS